MTIENIPNKQPKRGEGPFILELSDGCSGLSIPYRWITKLIFGEEKKLSFLRYCTEHDEAYWYGGSAQQRKDADNKLFHGVRCQADSPLSHLCYFPLACIMWIVPRVVGSPRLPTPFRWMRRDYYSPDLNYTVDDVVKDSTVATVKDAEIVMLILDDPDTYPTTVEEAIVEYDELVELSEELDRQNSGTPVSSK